MNRWPRLVVFRNTRVFCRFLARNIREGTLLNVLVCTTRRLNRLKNLAHLPDRGEVAGHGNNVGKGNVAKPNVTTAADLGLRRDEIHEAFMFPSGT